MFKSVFNFFRQIINRTDNTKATSSNTKEISTKAIVLSSCLDQNLLESKLAFEELKRIEVEVERKEKELINKIEQREDNIRTLSIQLSEKESAITSFKNKLNSVEQKLETTKLKLIETEQNRQKTLLDLEKNKNIARNTLTALENVEATRTSLDRFTNFHNIAQLFKDAIKTTTPLTAEKLKEQIETAATSDQLTERFKSLSSYSPTTEETTKTAITTKPTETKKKETKTPKNKILEELE